VLSAISEAIFPLSVQRLVCSAHLMELQGAFMGELVRFGVSMEDGLLQQFDQLIGRRGYANRSEALRDLVRAAIVENLWQHNSSPTVGVVCLVYDHETGDVGHKLTHIQHESQIQVVSSMHVHLDHHNCLETIVLRGRSTDIQTTADQLISLRGVKLGKLVMGHTGHGL
jgi:CopG family transcriptional regulator, nickel-responsive regulator